ncbi:hypothetical protein [Nitrogeniibacter aestuarii]|uniref:hypothetical protein n=1 Tax=Nitrogeniibacter aestuarii TaxID=2815343 RepID=UPI001E296157|nr:hypothetical protein [Nitrogeniibacter aestuarii]
MWIGKLKYGAAITCISLSAACTSAEPPAPAEPLTAWWLTLHLDANDQQVAGIPISQLNPAWSGASELTLKKLEAIVSDTELKALTNTQLRLSASADLNGDGAPERYLVGVYRTPAGQTGRFLLALTGNTPQAHMVTDRSEAAFSALELSGNTMNWYKCLQCGEFEVVRWSNGRLVVE